MRASEGIQALDVAIDDARESIRRAAFSFSGTVPPPPWPSPDLYDAIAEAADVRQKLQTLVDAGDADFDPNSIKVRFVRAQIEQKIGSLQAATKALNERLVETKQQTPGKLLQAAETKVKKKALSLVSGPAAVAALALVALYLAED